ncbi:unnamed protein product [Lota lota]
MSWLRACWEAAMGLALLTHRKVRMNSSAFILQTLRLLAPLPLLRDREAAPQEVELISTAGQSGHFLLGRNADLEASWLSNDNTM